MYKLYLGWLEVNRAYSAQELREAMGRLGSASRRAAGWVGGHRWTCHFDSLGDLADYGQGRNGQLSSGRVELEKQIPDTPDFKAITVLVDAYTNQIFVFHIVDGKYVYKRTFPYSPTRIAEGELWADDETTRMDWVQKAQHLLNEDELKKYDYEAVRPD